MILDVYLGLMPSLEAERTALDRYSICAEESICFVHLCRLATILTCGSEARGLVPR
jgi:hypothetical protein